jgi:hypothetical protein
MGQPQVDSAQRNNPALAGDANPVGRPTLEITNSDEARERGDGAPERRALKG